jgi:hypothetical protein
MYICIEDICRGDEKIEPRAFGEGLQSLLQGAGVEQVIGVEKDDMGGGGGVEARVAGLGTADDLLQMDDPEAVVVGR